MNLLESVAAQSGIQVVDRNEEDVGSAFRQHYRINYPKDPQINGEYSAPIFLATCNEPIGVMIAVYLGKLQY